VDRVSQVVSTTEAGAQVIAEALEAGRSVLAPVAVHGDRLRRELQTIVRELAS
jgi:hypothetical protein